MNNSNIKKLLWMKFIGGPGDMKSITLRNLVNFRENSENHNQKFYQEMKNLKVTIINARISDLHPCEPSEVFARLDLALTKAHEDIIDIVTNNDHENFDVIVEGQPIEEIALYALAYRVSGKITDFSLNLFLKRYQEMKEKLWKLQECVTMIYLVDDPDDNYFRLTKRRRVMEVYNKDFVNAYTCIMLSNFINDDDNLIIRASTGESETQNTLFENISKFMQTSSETA